MSNSVKVQIKDKNTIEIVLGNNISVDATKPLRPSTLEAIAAIYRVEDDISSQSGCIGKSSGCWVEW